MNVKHAFASIVAANLNASELAADRQLAQLGVTLSDLAGGRAAAGFAAGPGQRGLDHLAEAIALNVAARRSLVAAHDSLARDARRLKLTWAAPEGPTADPLEKLPGEDKPETTGRRLAETVG
jgi:hypothetical protein